jgi:glycerol-3-phosphate O-acyltransferase
MYEENVTPLPPGDASILFAEILADMRRDAADNTAAVSPETVLQYSNRPNLQRFGAISRRLLLPGSRIDGVEHLEELGRRAAAGESCLLCLNHRSNLDVPTLYALLADQANEGVFHRIIWVAGRKLTEDCVATRVMVGCFNRLVMTPKSWMTDDHTNAELHDAHVLNIAAQRTMMDLRHDGWIVGLFPSGTRLRPADDSTARALDETDTYVKSFQQMVLGHIQGCTMPVSHDWHLLNETPRLDQMVYTFGPVLDTTDWRERAARRSPESSQRDASARAIMEDINALAPSAE